MNKYAPHLYVIPEDDADRQIALGFVDYHKVDDRRIQVMPPAGGWSNVIRIFTVEYVQKLRNCPQAHVVMLIDFDGHISERRAEFEHDIPADLRMRVFVVGSKDNPESLKKGLRSSFEEIGTALAHDCDARTTAVWDHEQLQHNDAERQRLFDTVRRFLF